MKRVLSFFCAICLLASCLTVISMKVEATSNPYGSWQDADGDGYGELPCTYYAWQQAYDRLGIALPAWQDAIKWYDSARNAGYSVGTTPQANSIAVWSVSSHGWGHVGFVTAVNGSWMTINEGGRIDYDGLYKGNVVTDTDGVVNGASVPSVVGQAWYDRTLIGFIYLTSAPIEINYTNISQDVYYIRNVYNDECLSVDGGIDAQGQNVIVWPYNEHIASQIEVIPYGSGYKLRSGCSTTRVINPNGVSVVPGLNVDIWDSVDDGTQVWGFEKVDGGYVIRSMQNQSCVLALADDGRDVVTESYTGSKDQIWTLTPKDCKHPSYSSSVTKQPTCTATGTRTYTCTTCGSIKTESIAAKDHSYANATCTTPKTCTVCGTTTGSANGHSYGSWYTVKAATCTDRGGQRRDCKNCSASETQTISPLGHTEVTIPAVAPTVNTTGLTEGKKCSVCGVILVKQEPIPVLEEFTYTVTNGEATITGYNGNGGDITIPSTLDGYPVTAIGEAAFWKCTSITSITISNSVTTIGNYAFDECDSLPSITIPANVSSIGNYAFEECTSLKTIWVDAENPNYSSDSNGVLFNKDKTTLIQAPGAISESYTIPDSVIAICARAFYSCDNLTSVTIPDSVTSMGAYAFWKCANLTSITIGNGVTNIGINTFEYCSSLTGVTIGNSVATIEDKAFRDCTSLTDVYYSGTLEQWNAISIGNYNDPLLDATIYFEPYTYTVENGEATITGYTGTGGDIIIPSILGGYPVTVIADSAFSNCDGLTSVTIPDSVTTIGQSAFAYSIKLTSVIIGDGVTTIGNSAFDHCYEFSSVTIGDSVTTIGEYAFQCTSLTSLTIPNGVTTIGRYAFNACTRLTSVTISDSVTTIGTGAFSSCNSISGIWVSEDNPNFSSDDNGVLFNKYKTTILQVPAGVAGEYTIPDSVTTIGNSAFSSCVSLTAVIIPDGVTTIGSSAFVNCDGLTSITIPDSVTTIGSKAFYYCDSLTSVTIPNSVITIDEDAFYGCTCLTDVHYIGTQEQWDAISICSGNNRLKNATIHFHSHEYNAKVIAPTCTEAGYTTYTCSCGDTYIADEAEPLGHAELIDAAVAPTCTETGLTEGKHCSACNEVLVAQEVVEALGHTEEIILAVAPTETTTGLTEGKKCAACDEILVAQEVIPALEGNADYTYTVENDETTITGYTGEGGDITIPSVLGGYPVTTIGEKAFDGNTSLTAVTISEGVTSIGAYAFRNCTALTTVNIPDSVADMANYVFYGCTSLAGIWVDENNAAFSNDDSGVLFDKEKTTLLQVPGGIVGAYTIPNGVTTIKGTAFYNCLNLTGVTIPNGVTAIGIKAFMGCKSLTSVVVPDSVTTLGESAFYSCRSLTSAKLGSSMNTIGRTAFANCVSLKEIYIPVSMTHINKDAFYSCSALTDVYYEGTQTQWNALTVSTGNDALNNADIHYNYCLLEITNTAGNQHVIKNSSISFTVELNKTEGVTYQWQRCKNGTTWTNVSYNGNKTKTVTFDAASWAQFPFRCEITDANGTKIYTDSYTYTLEEPPIAPAITSNPKDVYLITGGTATFSVAAEGSGLTYQWWRSKNGGATYGEYTGTGGQTSSISLKVYSGQEYLYMCEVKDGYGNTLKTKVVQPHLITTVKITSQPTVAVTDSTATFSFTATGDVRTYQWERLKTNGWVDANSASYVGNNTTTMSTTVNGTFRCRITDLAGNVTYTNQVTFTK